MLDDEMSDDITIRSYEFDAYGLQLQQGAEILTVKISGGRPRLWARVDLRNPMVTRRLLVALNGSKHPKLAIGKYVGTFSEPASGIRFVFDLGEVEA